MTTTEKTYTESLLEMEFYAHSIPQMASTRHAEKKLEEGGLVTVAIRSLAFDTGSARAVLGPGELERGPRGPGDLDSLDSLGNDIKNFCLTYKIKSWVLQNIIYQNLNKLSLASIFIYPITRLYQRINNLVWN